MDTSNIPFTIGRASIDIESIQEMAETRAVPLTLEQRRDSQGRYQSHKDMPEPRRSTESKPTTEAKHMPESKPMPETRRISENKPHDE